MRKILILIIFFTLTIGYSQENKIKLRSISTAFGGFQPSRGPNGNANFYFSADATFDWNKNLLSASINRGFDLEIIGKGTRYNIEFDFLYGREIQLYKWISLEVHTGIGYFSGSYYKNDYQTWEDKWYFIKNQDNTKNHVRLGSLSLPVKLKLLFYLSQSFSIGANINYSLNKVSNVSAYSIILLKKF